MDASLTVVLDLLNKGGVLALLALALVAGYKGWWVWGSTHKAQLEDSQRQLDRVLAERDRLLDLALSANSIAGQAVDHLTGRLPGGKA